MTANVDEFDRWIRSGFIEMNTALEERYFAQENRQQIEAVGDTIKHQLVEEGKAYILKLLTEGNTDEGFDAGFDVLGNVGLYMAACRRHEITAPSRETTSPLKEASALAMQLGASLNLAPRFATSHLATHNRAVNGRYKTFTSLEDEYIFLDYNTLGVLSYKRAADALRRIVPLGVSHPVTYELLKVAKDALQDVTKYNAILFDKLDRDRFFFCVRPYYKPYRVGQNEYRGANAGDFAGINMIDMLLGLCRADNPSYSQILIDKMLFMMPEDQALLRDCMRRKSLMDEFLEVADSHSSESWYQRNLTAFLEACEMHGETAAQHHNQLVGKYIEQPAQRIPEKHLEHITASGPPLNVLLRSLEKLRDLRMAADRDDIPTRYGDIQRLKASLG